MHCDSTAQIKTTSSMVCNGCMLCQIHRQIVPCLNRTTVSRAQSSWVGIGDEAAVVSQADRSRLGSDKIGPHPTDETQNKLKKNS